MKVPLKVYELLGIDPEPKDNPWLGGIKEFNEIPYDNIEKIAEILGEEFLNQTQNHSPSTREFLEKLKPYRDQTVFYGYVVSPTRSDERVTIEAVKTVKNDDTILMFRYADDFQFTEDGLLYVWWD